MRILSLAEWCLRVARRISRTSLLAGTLAGGAEDFWFIFTLLGITMTQKSSVPQIVNLVPVGADAALDLSRIYAAPLSRLGCLAIECQGVFPSQC
jgi:hypothetical protein